MKLYKSPIAIIIIILLLIYINYFSKKYDNFIILESSLDSMSNKIYYLKKNHDKKVKLLLLYKKLIQIDNDIYNIILEKFDNNYNRNLILLNKEVENIKNLNKIYENKLFNLDDINKLNIIKKDYENKLSKIQNMGYNKIINIELENLNLLNNYYYFYKNNFNKKYSFCSENCINDIYNILNDFESKLYNNKKRGILKNAKNSCNIHITWEGRDNNIKCCNIK